MTPTTTPQPVPWIAILAVDAILLSLAAWWMSRSLRARIRDAGRTAAEDARNAEIASMTRGLAHEIKNPLSTVALNAQLLREEILDSGIEDAARDRVTRRVDTLAREAARLRDILNDFLRYAGRMQLDRRPIDVRTVAEDLADFFLAQAEQAGVRMRTELPADPAMADADPALMKQAILNLLLNGVQAMESLPPEATRTLTLRVTPVPPEGRGAAARPARIAIEVQDTGPGLAPEARAQAFEPYFTTKAGGNGLGLATARRIVEAHGGSIGVADGTPGARFRIELPAVSPASPSS